MDNPLLSTFRHAGLFMRTVTGTVLLTFTMLVLAPTAMAAQAEIKKAKNEALMKPSEEEELSKTILEIDEKLKGMQQRRVKGKGAQKSPAGAAALQGEKEQLKALRRKAEALDANVMANFAAVEKHIRDKKLPPVIMERQKEAVKQYKAEMAAMLANLRDAEGAKSDGELNTRIDKAAKHLGSRKLKSGQRPFDPNNLPNQSLAPTKAKPKKTRREFTNAGLFDTPYQKYAALGDFKYDKLAGANDPAYLAESVEVKITQAVKDQAAALNHDPVEIYHWVLNNVVWIPSWGSMQDADHTLSSRRGNAMDISSLTIALLRASGIPARYVHGTVQVPEDKFRNWTGGFETVEAAGNFSASGGIPSVGVIEGGKISKMEIEHVWVEAAIDFHPSRGAVNRDADAWVEMDPSYKQYEFVQGPDVSKLAGIDATNVMQDLAEQGTANEAEGWVQGLSRSIVDNSTIAGKAALDTHLSRLSDPKVADIISGSKIIVKSFPMLPSALMNAVVVKGARYAVLPSALQHKVTFSLGYDPYSGAPEITYPLAQVLNQKVTVSFRPATQADEQAFRSFFPASASDPSQLPTNVPGYAVKVLPELRVEGQVVLTGSAAMSLGAELQLQYATAIVNHGTKHYSSTIPAGGYYAFWVAGSSAAPARAAAASAKLEQTKAALQDAALFASLSRDDLLGDLFYSGTLGYSAEYVFMTQLVGQRQGAIGELAPSLGIYGYTPSVKYFFGLPRAIGSGSVEMDLPGLNSYSAVLDNNRDKLIKYRLVCGLFGSSLESGIPEQMFVSADHPGEGVSAVKLLNKAVTQGQRVYQLTSANMAAALPNLHFDSATMSDVTSSVAAGKTVFIHTDPISVGAWSGAGYVIFDASNGDGAYMISGGLNGGSLLFWATVLFLAITIAIALVTGELWLAAVAGVAYYLFLHRVEAIAHSNLTPDQMYAELNKAAALAVMGVAGSIALGAMGMPLMTLPLDFFLFGFLTEFDLCWPVG